MSSHCAPASRVSRLMRKSMVCICSPDPVTGRLNPFRQGPAQQRQNGGIVSPARVHGQANPGRPNDYPIPPAKLDLKKSIFGRSGNETFKNLVLYF